MESTLLKDGLVLSQGKTRRADVRIEDGRIAAVGRLKGKADAVIDASGKAVVPGFVNTHTHAAMALLRGLADDVELHRWLDEFIWPAEKKLTADDVYWGAKLACLEMLKSGTTCFNDMYFFSEATARAASELGIRAFVSEAFFDKVSPGSRVKARKAVRSLRKFGPLVTPVLGPHSVYSMTGEGLRWAARHAEENRLLVHTHLSETEKETADCVRESGMRPVGFLESLGFLGDRVVAAHGVWVGAAEAGLLARRGVTIAHNPTSNMKLGSGTLPYGLLRKAGVRVSLGTDGCASNNNLDMLEEMKFAALAQKSRDTTAMPAAEAFDLATVNGARALRLDAGAIEPGRLADIILIDLKRPELVPVHDLVSNLVYSANGACVDTVICNGRVVMRGRHVPGEEEIIEKAADKAAGLAAAVRPASLPAP